MVSMRSKVFSVCAITVLFLSSIIIVACFNSSVSAATTISGVISSDTTWTLANSPYSLTGNVLVNQSVTLTIEPGVTVNLNTYYIRIDGTLKAEGTSTNQISLIRTDTSNTPNDQPGIQFTGKSNPWSEITKNGSIISNALVSSSILGMTHTISIESASPKICDSTIVNLGDQRAIWIQDGNPIIANNSISAKIEGVTITSGSYGGNVTCTIANNTITNCQVGIEVYSGRPLIEGNLIVNNTGSKNSGAGGIRIDYAFTIPTIRNNTIVFNSVGLNFLENANATILYNNIQNNKDYNIYLYSPQTTGNINASYNWWGTIDLDAVKQSMYDFKNDFNLGNVYLDPLLTAPNNQAPTYVNASASTGGSISSSGVTRLNYGDSKSFNISPNSGYHVADVLVNGSSVGAVTSYTVQNAQGATTISAVFAADPTPTANPTSNPTSNPTTSPTNSPTVSPSPTPTVPELPSVALVALLIVGLAGAILFYRRRNYNRDA
jgi:parallel beta-helix repeat protein